MQTKIPRVFILMGMKRRREKNKLVMCLIYNLTLCFKKEDCGSIKQNIACVTRRDDVGIPLMLSSTKEDSLVSETTRNGRTSYM